MLSEDMMINLRMYYTWARNQCPMDISYPHEIPTRRLQGRQVAAVGLTDDEARQIDRALCALREVNAAAFTVVEEHVAMGESLRDMEKQLPYSRKTPSWYEFW